MTIADKIQRLQTAKGNIASAITAKGGTVASGDGFEDFPTGIGTIPTKQAVSWHQCPTAVRNYLSNVTYDPSDYTTSHIATYAPATAVSSNTKPIGQTVDGVTYYNEVPNAQTPFSSANTAGTLTPLDALRWLNTSTYNVRDLGGWACDGGTVKYGMLVRGGEPVAADKSLMVGTVGIKHELQLRGASEAPQQYSLWGIGFTCPEAYNWMSLANTDTWKQVIRCVFDNVTKEKPVFVHCGAGADRTGTVAVMLEALLGMSQSDIDKDYELTCFATGSGTDVDARRRNESEYKNYIAAIKAVPLEGGLSDSFRNRAVSFVLSLGFTIDEINAYRAAMVSGTPTAITVSMDSYTITKSGANVTFDNQAASVNEYQPYTVNLSANAGYVITGVNVTMGGNTISAFSGKEVNLFRSVENTLSHCTTNNANYSCISGQGYGATITADEHYTLEGATVSITMGGAEVSQLYYSNGTIAIPNVTGNISISVTAVQQGPSYTNIWATPNGINTRLNSSETANTANGMFVSAWFDISAEQMAGDIVLRSNMDIFNCSPISSQGDYFRLYPSSTAGSQVVSNGMNNTSLCTRSYDSTTGIYTLTVKHSSFSSKISQITKFRWCAAVSTSAISQSFFDGCILTLNEDIA